MENMELQDSGEAGLTQDQFETETRNAQKKIERDLRHQPENVYVVFKSKDARDSAFRIIEEARKNGEELFTFLTNFYEDPQQQDLGITLEFKQFDLERATQVQDFFNKNNIADTRVYDTLDGQPIN